MFDFAQVLEIVKIEPGHNLVQSFLLLMIWISSRGIRKDMAGLRSSTEKRFEKVEGQVNNHEGRIFVLEKIRGKNE